MSFAFFIYRSGFLPRMLGLSIERGLPMKIISTESTERKSSHFPLSKGNLLGLSGAGMAGVLIAMGGVVVGCASTGAQASCLSRTEILPASSASSLIAVVPRTSARAARWGLDQMARLLPLVARGGLDLHVFYTEDNDDLGEGGGDGGPAQILQAQAPTFHAVSVPGEPARPADPTALTAKLYCEHLVAWENHASRVLSATDSRRATAALTWARTAAARLRASASLPVPDTTGAEGNVEFDAGASVFAAAQVAQAAPLPTIVFLGGLDTLAAPSENFAFPGHLVVLVRSTNPARVIRAERAWSRWATRNGGAFQALSADDAPTVIARALAS